MAIRARSDGTMWCAAHTPELPGDTYIDDALHYQMSVEHGVIVALPMPEHVDHPQWWWAAQAPANAEPRKPWNIPGERYSPMIDRAAGDGVEPYAMMLPDPKGRWVRVSDYAAAVAQDETP